MCGIVGYVGINDAKNILLNGLSRLEYRGYDSAGIAVRDSKNNIQIVKEKGKIKNLVDKLNDKDCLGCNGIGHTRWATHGVPSVTNAHPHSSMDGSITLVHNGIIENFLELKKKLEGHDYKFKSETDSEVVANLIDYYYKKYNMGPIDAINKMMVRVRGSFALAIMFKDYPDEVWVARKDSPLIIGTNNDGNYIASDVPAILNYTNKVYYLDNYESACCKKDSVTFYNLDGNEVSKEVKVIEWNVDAAKKDGYEHFMIKEINEQPDAVRKTLNSLIIDGKIDLEKVGFTKDEIKKYKHIYIIACGSAYHVGVNAKYLIEDLCKIPVTVDVASEFRYRNPIMEKNSLFIVISQSGETADSLAALRMAKECGITTLGIVNVVGSSIAREANKVLYTLAGPEIAVATTKAYSAQIAAITSLAIEMAYVRRKITKKAYNDLIKELITIPDKIKEIIDNNVSKIQNLSEKFESVKDAFFLGRNLDYAISLEGSLKLKEISYIHSEAYAAGELKHGTISLIEDNTLVIGIVTQKCIHEKTISNIVEVKSRGAYVIGVHPSDIDLSKCSDTDIVIPKTNDYLYSSLAVIPLQLLSYYISVARGLDVDKPRNLAKSVTVE